jgi:hypothetical protein
MKGKSLISENLELAYRIWRECGQSPEATVKKLNSEHDYTVSRQTIYEWMEKYNWKERAAAAEAVEQKAKDPQLSGTEKMLTSLVSSQQRYEKYFESLGVLGIDNQAQYAYNNTMETIVSIRKKLEEKPDLFRMTPIVMDAFVQFIKKVEKDQAAQAPVFALIDRFFDDVNPN